jgi:nucleoside-diphosphate-sugar epimerase
MGAIANWNASIGESFHAVSEQALTLRGYAESMSHWFGQEPKLSFAPFDAWAKSQTAEDAEATWEHIARSPNCSIAKAGRLLGYTPRYTSLQAVQESVGWLVEQGRIET